MTQRLLPNTTPPPPLRASADADWPRRIRSSSSLHQAKGLGLRSFCLQGMEERESSDGTCSRISCGGDHLEE